MRTAMDETVITRTFTECVQAFQTLNPQAIVPYCHVPCMFGRSELTDLQVSQMNETIAFVSVSRVRYKTDRQELERLGETYTFLKSDGA